MLLPSFGRASFERAVVVSSGQIKGVLHNALKSRYIGLGQLKVVLPNTTSLNTTIRPYATGASAVSSAKRKPITKSSTKNPRKTVRKSGTKKAKKSSISNGRKKIVKKVAKKPAKKLIKKPRKVKRVLSDEQKNIIKQKLLKAQALVLPKLLPRTARTVFMADCLKGYTGTGITTKFTEISSSWASISESQKLNYEKKAESNRIANAHTMKTWLAAHSPDQIRLANNARRTLSRSKLSKRAWFQIPDPRMPKRPTSSFIYYMQERHSAGDFDGLAFQETARKYSAGFNALSPAERKRYHDMYLIDRKRYLQQYKETFKREANVVQKDA